MNGKFVEEFLGNCKNQFNVNIITPTKMYSLPAENAQVQGEDLVVKTFPEKFPPIAAKLAIIPIAQIIALEVDAATVETKMSIKMLDGRRNVPAGDAALDDEGIATRAKKIAAFEIERVSPVCKLLDMRAKLLSPHSFAVNTWPKEIEVAVTITLPTACQKQVVPQLERRIYDFMDNSLVDSESKPVSGWPRR